MLRKTVITEDTEVKIKIVKRAFVFSAILLLLGAVTAAGKRPTAEIEFVVVKDSNGKPLRNASVVLHPVKKNGEQSLGGMELKTDMDGKTGIDGIPYGKLRIQVIAQHMRTYGADYDINQPQMQITIKMQAPSDQYSIYH
jgi:hypothetical protein